MFIFVHAFLTKAAFSGERDSFSGGKRLFTPCTGEAVLMVGLAQGRDDFAFDVVAALGALRAVV